jgi:hypothetical protein
MQVIGIMLWPTVLIIMIAQGSLAAGGIGAWAAASWWLLPLVAITGVGPFALWPVLYRRRGCADVGWRTTAAWMLGYWLYMYQSYACVPRAFGRLIIGKNTWAKTRRNAEADQQLQAREA